MKKVIFYLILLLSSVNSFGQVPSYFSYQAVLRDSSGKIKADENVVIGISISDETSTEVFSENQSVKTNSHGLITLNIGSVNQTLGNVNWSTGKYFITIFVDGVEMGTSQLLSVPFSMYSNRAKVAESIDNLKPISINLVDKDAILNNKSVSISGSDLSIVNSSNRYVIPLTEVKANELYIFQTNNFPSIANTWIHDVKVVFLDADQKVISSSVFSRNNTGELGMACYLENHLGFYFISPDNCKYVVLEHQQAYAEGKDFLLFEYKYSKDVLQTNSKLQQSDENVIKLAGQPQTGNLSLWVLGDSNTATGYGADIRVPNTNIQAANGLGGWIRFFIERVRPLKWYNYAVGGYTLTDTTNDLSGNSFLKKLEDAISDYQSGIIDAPDYLFIVACTNDFNPTPTRFVTDEEVSTSGKTYDRYMEENFFLGGDLDVYNGYYLKPLEEVNKGKIVGAIRYIVERVGTIFPECKFVIVTPSQSAAHTLVNQQKCVAEMKWTANRLSIPVIDVWGRANMPMLWDYKQKDGSEPHRYLTDRVHAFPQTGLNGSQYYGEFVAREFLRLIE